MRLPTAARKLHLLQHGALLQMLEWVGPAAYTEKKTMKPVSLKLKLLPFYSTRVSDVQDVGHRNV